MPGYYAGIARAIEAHRRYPRRARRQGTEGTVKIVLIIDRSGHLVGAPTVHASSGSDDLDHAALAMVKSAAPFAAIPSGHPNDVVRVVLPVRFQLNGAPE